MHHFERALNIRLILLGVKPGESTHPRYIFVDLGIVFHSATAQWEQVFVHMVIQYRKFRVVTHHLRFTHFRETDRTLTKIFRGDVRRSIGHSAGKPVSRATATALVIDRFRHHVLRATSRSTSPNLSKSSLVCFSVTAMSNALRAISP